VRFVSTAGRTPPVTLGHALLEGPAPDGGLYVPEDLPALNAADLAALQSLPLTGIAAVLGSRLFGSEVPEEELADLVEDALDFPIPLAPIEPGIHCLELFHGPTLAFKDIALQLVGRLFDHELARRGERVTIVGATSGDTGSAAIEACRDRDSLDIFVLHPAGRVTEVQRRQMTTVASPNVHNIAVDGSFDDCQDLVKAMFADESFRGRHRLAAVNSINFARVMAQVVYYVAAARALGGEGAAPPVGFAVPTGNFGNVYAGYAAHRMGLDVSQFIVGSNVNDVLARFFDSARLEIREVVPTMSPSMDIQVSSNLERLLFELNGRDGAATAHGDPARGSRYNSAVRYHKEHRDSLLVVISDDRTVDLIPSLRPKLHQAEVQAAVNAFCETCEAEPVDGEMFALTHRRVEKLAFYLDADQCQRVNDAREAEMRRRLEAGGIAAHRPPLRPHPDMDNSYFH